MNEICFIDKSIRHDIGEFETDSIKRRLRELIKDSSVTVVLIGAETGGRKWVDWEIQNSLRKYEGNGRNGLLGVRIKYKQHWVSERLEDNVLEMGLIIDWPRERNLRPDPHRLRRTCLRRIYLHRICLHRICLRPQLWQWLHNRHPVPQYVKALKNGSETTIREGACNFLWVGENHGDAIPVSVR